MEVSMILEIILGSVIGICILLFVFAVQNNKFQLAIIKIDKAQEDISLYLQKKEELLNRAKPIIEKEIKKEDVLSDLENVPEDSNNFEIHFLLKRTYNEFFKILDENEKLLKSKPLLSILEELNTNEENILGSIKFYNDTVVGYNHLVVSFPSSILAFVRRYKKKEFYSNEKIENFEILKDE